MKSGTDDINQTLSLFDKILHSSSVGINVFRISDRRSYFVNQAFLNMTGYTLDELRDHTEAELKMYIDQEQLNHWMKTLARGENIYYQDTQIRHKSGEIRHLIASLEPVVLSGENMVIVIANDITNWKIYETALLESEEKFRSLFMNLIDGVLLTSPDGKILAANPAACQMLGRTEKEIISLERSDLVDNSDERVHKMVEERNRTGIAKGELFMLRADGSRFPAELTSTIFVTPNGEKRTSMIIRDITKRKEIEEAHRIAEEKYQKIFEASPELIMLTDLASGKIVAVNKRMESLVGFNVDDVIGRRTTEIEIWGEPYQRDRYVECLLREGRVQNMEVKLRIRSGEIRDAILNGELIELRNGKHILGVIHDVTEIRKMEEELKLSLDMFRKAFEQGPAARCITRISDNKFVQVNDSFLELFDLVGHEVIGHTPTELQLTTQKEQSVINGQKQESSSYSNDELIIRTRSGKTLNLIYSTRPFEVRGEPCRITTVVDITSRKIAEYALIQSEERLRLATDQANIAVWEYDFVTNNMSRSHNHDRLFGLELQQHWDKYSFFAAIHPDDREYSNAFIMNSLAPGGPDDYRFDFRVIYPDGSIHWLETTGKVTRRNERGEGIIARGTLADITERKVTEENLIRSRQEIRDLAFHIDSVRENERKAIALNLHDDLGQKLTAIRIDLNRLKTGRYSTDSDFAGKVNNMIDILDDTVRTVQRISSELRPSILYDLGLKDAIEWQMKEFTRTTGIRHKIRFDPENIDPDKDISATIFRIIQESLTNVARHSGATAIDFEMKTDGSFVKCTLKDNGRGIDENRIKRSDSFGLMGMRERAEFLNGRIEISGTPGRGTTVTLYIPVAFNSPSSEAQQ